MNDLNFLKLDVDILGNKKMRYIRTLKNGDTMFVMWIGLLCLGQKSETLGRLEIAEGIPYDKKTLSNELSISEEIVENALELFLNLKMLVKSKTFYEIKNTSIYQSVEAIEHFRELNRERQKRYRNKKKTGTQKPAKDETGQDAIHTIPPKYEDVQARFKELFEKHNLLITDAELETEKFYNYYRDNDWQIKNSANKKSKMKDWHKAVDNWIRNYKSFKKTTYKKSIKNYGAGGQSNLAFTGKKY